MADDNLELLYTRCDRAIASRDSEEERPLLASDEEESMDAGLRQALQESGEDEDGERWDFQS